MPPNNHIEDCTLEISQGNYQIQLSIQFGDVWFCSGQSNMERPLRGIFESREEQIKIVRFIQFYCMNFSTNYPNSPIENS